MDKRFKIAAYGLVLLNAVGSECPVEPTGLTCRSWVSSRMAGSARSGRQIVGLTLSVMLDTPERLLSREQIGKADIPSGELARPLFGRLQLIVERDFGNVAGGECWQCRDRGHTGRVWHFERRQRVFWRIVRFELF